jgi:hypothetical protein
MFAQQQVRRFLRKLSPQRHHVTVTVFLIVASYYFIMSVNVGDRIINEISLDPTDPSTQNHKVVGDKHFFSQNSIK